MTLRSRGVSLSLLASLCLSATAAHGASPREEQERAAVRALDRGADLFLKGQLDDALAAFEEGQRLVPDKANPYRWIGITEARMGRCEPAVAHLDEFLSRVPQNDPRTVEAVTIRDRCRAELTMRRGTIVVTSEPTGATVRLDDAKSTPRGSAPLRLDVMPGRHVVYGVFGDGALEERAVEVPPGGEVETHFAFAPTTGPAPRTGEKPSRRGLVIALAVVGAVVVVGAGVGVGVWAAERNDPFATDHTMMLPPIQSP